MSKAIKATFLFAIASLLLGALASAATITQKGNLRVSVEGNLSPKKLPRKGAAPVAVSVAGRGT